MIFLLVSAITHPIFLNDSRLLLRLERCGESQLTAAVTWSALATPPVSKSGSDAKEKRMKSMHDRKPYILKVIDTTEWIHASFLNITADLTRMYMPTVHRLQLASEIVSWMTENSAVRIVPPMTTHQNKNIRLCTSTLAHDLGCIPTHLLAMQSCQTR